MIKPGTKLKDLPNTVNLGGLRVKTNTGRIGIWKSQWTKGVWLSNGETDRIYPQFVKQLEDCLEWEITDEPVNL